MNTLKWLRSSWCALWSNLSFVVLVFILWICRRVLFLLRGPCLLAPSPLLPPPRWDFLSLPSSLVQFEPEQKWPACVRLPPTGQKWSQLYFFPHKQIKMLCHDLKGRSSMSAIFVLKTFQPGRGFRSCLTASFCASRGSPGSGWRTGLRDVPPLVPPSRPVEHTAHTHRRLLTLPQHTPPAPSCTTSTGLVLIMISLFFILSDPNINNVMWQYWRYCSVVGCVLAQRYSVCPPEGTVGIVSHSGCIIQKTIILFCPEKWECLNIKHEL